MNCFAKRTAHPFAVAAILALVCAACGTSEIASEQESQLGDAVADVAVDTGGTGGDSKAGDDDGGKATGKSCLSKTECSKMMGISPCRVPICEGADFANKIKGVCKLQAHPKGTQCIDNHLPLNECQQTLCDDKGECVAEPRPKTAGCTDQNVTANECQEKRCDGAGTCEVRAKKDGEGCGGAIACGKVCKAGKCTAQTSADYDDKNPCTKDFCDQGQEIKHEPIDDLTISCDDGDNCTGDEHCKKGKCTGKKLTCNDGHSCTADKCDTEKGCINTPDDKKCADDGNPCTKLGCDKEKGCIAASFNKDAKCDDGDKCTPTDKCDDKGACVGSDSTCNCNADVDCDQSDLCAPRKCEAKKCVIDQAKIKKCDASGNNECGVNTCDPKTGACAMKAKNEGKPCDDNSVCTAKSTCAKGVCAGPVTQKCDDKDPCTEDSCDGLKGCVTAPGAGKCDDGNKCTSGDQCVNGACKGTTSPCDDGVPCTFDGCDKATGKCTHKVNDKSCDDGNVCTSNKCDAKKGCTYPADNAAKCDDGNKCTDDKCASGKCEGTFDPKKDGCGCKDDKGCDDGKFCTTNKCDAGNCKFDPKGMDGKACDDGVKCNVANSGKCASGKCSPGKPKVCKAGPCETAYCDAKTGNCVTAKKADGTACQDGNGCTVNDKCVTGKCAAGSDFNCKDPGGCKIAECQSTGATTQKCVAKNKKAGEPCDDGKYCTESDTCNSTGTCTGGKARNCSGTADACNTGVCDNAKKACVKKTKANGTACDDGKYCTVSDKCSSGKCASGAARKCPDASTCKVGSCSEAGKKCITVNATNGKTCSDGNACTSSDKCSSGACTGTAKVCAGNTCNTGACNKASGACYLVPKTGTIACKDGNACTSNDLCKSGKCIGTWDTKLCACKSNADCNDKNACTSDSCITVSGKKTCKNAITAGVSCSDGKLCTTGDKCSTKGTCIGIAKICNDKNVCTSDYCNTSTGACVYKPNTLSCNADNNACTVGDKCSSGKCIKGALKSCNDGTVCSVDSCNTKTGSCTYTASSTYQGKYCGKASSVCVSTKCGCKLYYTYQGSTSSTNYYYGLDVVPTTHGGSIHVGHYRNGSYFYPVIRTHNAHGTLTNSKTISGSKYFSSFQGAVHYGTSVFAAVGRVRYGSYYNGYFAQFDAKGNLLSGKYKQVYGSSSKNDYLDDVAYDPTYKRFWAAGHTYLYGNARGWLVRIDTAKSNGIGWHTVYGSSTKSTVFYGLGYYGGYLYPVGYTTGGTLGGFDGLVTRYARSSSSATLQKSYGYKYYGGSGSDIFHDVYVNASYLYLVGRTTTSSKGSYDAWIVRASRTSLAQYASYKYGGKGYDEYQRVAPWGSGVAVTGRERYYYTSTASSDQMTFALHSSSGSRYRQKLYGSNSYVDQGYGIAYTGSQGGRSYALTGYTSSNGVRGITAQVNESGTSNCGIIKLPGVGDGGKSN